MDYTIIDPNELSKIDDMFNAHGIYEEPFTRLLVDDPTRSVDGMYDEPVWADAGVKRLLDESDGSWDKDVYRVVYMSLMCPKKSLGPRTLLFEAPIGGVWMDFLVDKDLGNIIITRA